MWKYWRIAGNIRGNWKHRLKENYSRVGSQQIVGAIAIWSGCLFQKEPLFLQPLFICALKLLIRFLQLDCSLNCFPLEQFLRIIQTISHQQRGQSLVAEALFMLKQQYFLLWLQFSIILTIRWFKAEPILQLPNQAKKRLVDAHVGWLRWEGQFALDLLRLLMKTVDSELVKIDSLLGIQIIQIIFLPQAIKFEIQIIMIPFFLPLINR